MPFYEDKLTALLSSVLLKFRLITVVHLHFLHQFSYLERGCNESIIAWQ